LRNPRGGSSLAPLARWTIDEKEIAEIFTNNHGIIKVYQLSAQPTMSLFTISTGCWQRSRERRSAFSRSTILMAEISLLIKLKITVWASGRCFSWMTSA
jgi:hypothetical protein